MVASYEEEEKELGKILKRYSARKRKCKRSLIDDASEEDEEEAAYRRERIRVLREAQKVKEKSNWLNWVDNKVDNVPEEEKKENSAMEGLKYNFAQEQTDVQDERMIAYIEKEVSKRYRRETEQENANQVIIPSQWEQIQQLKRQLGLPLSKKSYQSEAILPAGGMEEVLVGENSSTSRSYK
ncbi:uncharacterized protein Gasu_12850 [Galdieria sulphuraria]|uniref:Uncharacterized protein n=1 Tax=Galdieria sulphuraria TaxID=130081 RepID=M2X553_GALSU|nr:uncharacterized protein Gasu_12850 [Galdieria sulphuraria]EME31615.1 hypothetical protein Gasu_12850 [Galdieria sulphuraria]|eukprot:XP_005708135.1 hypothetical protein Gasu_12850 [Galdieria sulphuraria]